MKTTTKTEQEVPAGKKDQRKVDAKLGKAAISNCSDKGHADNKPDHTVKQKVPSNSKPHTPTKKTLILRKLKAKNGATLADLLKVTNWQKHSVRGFLSTLRKQHKDIVTDKQKGKPTRYRIVNDGGVNV